MLNFRTLILSLLMMASALLASAQTNGQRAGSITFVSSLPGTCKPANGIIYGLLGSPVTYHICTATNTLTRIDNTAAVATAPVITSIAPQAVTAGSGAFTLTVNGVNFAAGAVVNWNSATRTTTFVSSTQVTAAITAPDVASAGAASISITSGGVTSAAISFVVPTTGTSTRIKAKESGLLGNGSSDDRAALNTLVNSTLQPNGGIVHFAAGSYLLNSAVTIPSNVVLEFAPSASLTIATAVTVTINGNILASPTQQIFALTGTGAVSIASNRAVREWSANWWGAKGDNSTDNSTTLQAAFDALKSGQNMYLPEMNYLAGALKIDRKMEAQISGTTFSNNPSGDPNTKTHIIYIGADGGTALTIENCYSCTLQNLSLLTNNTGDTARGADKGLYITQTAGGYPGLSSQNLIKAVDVRANNIRTNWIGILVDNTSGQNNEFHRIENCRVFGGINPLTSGSVGQQTGIKLTHSNEKGIRIQRLQVGYVGTGIQSVAATVHMADCVFTSVYTCYSGNFGDASSIRADDIENIYYYYIGNSNNLSVRDSRISAVVAACSSASTALVQITGGTVTFSNNVFSRGNNSTLGPYVIAGPSGNFPSVIIENCTFDIASLSLMMPGLNTLKTHWISGGADYLLGRDYTGGATGRLGNTPGYNSLRRMIDTYDPTNYANYGLQGTFFLGDDEISFMGLHSPSGLTVSVVGTPGSTTRKFALIARTAAGARTISVPAMGGPNIQITNAPSTLDGTNYLHFEWPTMVPTANNYQLYDVSVSDASNWRLVATITPVGGTLQTFDLQSEPSGSYTATRPTFNEASRVDMRTKIILPIETTLTANSTTPSVAIGNDFITANSVATNITDFTDGINGQIIRIRANDSNTTIVNSGGLLTGTGANLVLTNGVVYQFVRRGNGWRSIQ